MWDTWGQLSNDKTECRGILAKLKTNQNGFCLVSTHAGCKADGTGDVQVSWRGVNKIAILPDVAWAKGLKISPDQLLLHLCGRRNCVISSHVRCGDQKEKTSRHGCGVLVEMECEDRGCNATYIFVCPHDELCIPEDRPAGAPEDWEEFIRSEAVHIVRPEEGLSWPR
ncbi:hypothetical protein C2857_003594 [Epichloe festucae Fl1]|uniref:Uncharacterized protein n=1 Tax=Epichloe festucae (strain Fl1) TaxID=877507 RepID=A0A7S9PX02_EPIFF|nr:hypothetical protein C2857_003594 [Epichloe festucae Fl1]